MTDLTSVDVGARPVGEQSALRHTEAGKADVRISDAWPEVTDHFRPVRT